MAEFKIHCIDGPFMGHTVTTESTAVPQSITLHKRVDTIREYADGRAEVPGPDPEEIDAVTLRVHAFKARGLRDDLRDVAEEVVYFACSYEHPIEALRALWKTYSEAKRS